MTRALPPPSRRALVLAVALSRLAAARRPLLAAAAFLSRSLFVAVASLPFVACATVRPRIDVYLSEQAGSLPRPVEICLRSVEIFSNDIPLSADYPVVTDSLAAVASRYGFMLSNIDGNQPYAAEIEVREQTVTIDLAIRSSVVAILSLHSSSDRLPIARVVFASLGRESPLSLYRLYQIGEAMFVSLRRALTNAGA